MPLDIFALSVVGVGKNAISRLAIGDVLALRIGRTCPAIRDLIMTTSAVRIAIVASARIEVRVTNTDVRLSIRLRFGSVRVGIAFFATRIIDDMTLPRVTTNCKLTVSNFQVIEAILRRLTRNSCRLLVVGLLSRI
ncbi:hypothetical protein HN588_08125, partial [Candidatus Bathyarchaeota archaeon]|nr:hypothetical protein [Candidatus Bathyarchaeota archaeon]